MGKIIEELTEQYLLEKQKNLEESKAQIDTEIFQLTKRIGQLREHKRIIDIEIVKIIGLFEEESEENEEE